MKRKLLRSLGVLIALFFCTVSAFSHTVVILDYTPVTNTTDVGLRPTISINFHTLDGAWGDQDMLRESVEQWFRLVSADGNDVVHGDCTFTWGPAVSYGGGGETMRVSIVPNRNLYPDTQYNLTLIAAPRHSVNGVRHNFDDIDDDDLINPPNPNHHDFYLDGRLGQASTQPGGNTDNHNDFAISFTTRENAAAVPALVNHSPDAGDTNVPLRPTVTLYFSEPMDHASVEGNFSFEATTAGVLDIIGTSGTFVWEDDRTVHFTPSRDLLNNTQYTVYVGPNAEDQIGNAMPAQASFAFATGPVAAGAVLGVTFNPTTGSTNITKTPTITLHFNKQMIPGSVEGNFNLALVPASPSGTDNIGNSGTFTWSNDNQTVQFTPSRELLMNSTYRITVGTGSTDIAGNALAAPATSDFTVFGAADSPFSGTITEPANADVNVTVRPTITVQFNKQADRDLVEANFSLASTVAGQLDNHGNSGTFTWVDDRTVRFVPTRDLMLNTQYTATVAAGATDIAGNPLAGAVTSAFTVGPGPAAGLAVVNFVPVQDGVNNINLPVRPTLAMQFNKQVDKDSVVANFSLAASAGGLDVIGNSGTFTWVDDQTFTFTPSRDLLWNTQYTATVGANATDIAGNTFGGATSTLRVGPAVAALDILTIIPSGSNVPVNPVITVRFNKQMNHASVEGSFSMEATTAGVVDHIGGSGVFRWEDDYTVKFTPSRQLLLDTEYTVSVLGYDLAGNYVDHTSAPDRTFVVGNPANAAGDVLAVVANSPAAGAVNLPEVPSITVYFNKQMNRDTVQSNFSISATNVNITDLIGSSGTFTWLDDRSFTFVPDRELLWNTSYTVTVGQNSEDLAGNVMAADFTFNFTVGVADALFAVVTSSPTGDDNPLRPTITIQFNKQVNPDTLAANFTLEAVAVAGKDDDNIGSSGDFTWIDDKTVTFVPYRDLLRNRTYQVTINGGLASGVRDIAGNVLDGNRDGVIGAVDAFSWRFTISEANRPTLLSVRPVPGEQNVDINTIFSMTFSEPMDRASLEGAFWVDNGISASGTFTWSIDSKSVQFKPNVILTRNMTYEARISTMTAPFDSAAKDISGNVLNWVYPTPLISGTFFSTETSSHIYWKFKTAEMTRPVVLATSPRDWEQNVLLNGSITIAFSETMDTDSVEGAFDMKALTTEVISSTLGTPLLHIGNSGTFTWTNDNKTLHFKPSVTLVQLMTYEVNINIMTAPAMDISRNLLTDEGENPYYDNTDGFYTFRFKTIGDNVRPRVISHIPLNWSNDVSITPVIQVHFSEPMDTDSVEGSFELHELQVDGAGVFSTAVGTGTGIGRTGVFEWSDNDKTMKFTPLVQLDSNMTYAVTISCITTEFYRGARDKNGNVLLETGEDTSGKTPITVYPVVNVNGDDIYSWVFVAQDKDPPEVIATDPDSGQINVAVTNVITVTFSEPMNQATYTNQNFKVVDQNGHEVSGSFTTLNPNNFVWTQNRQVKLADGSTAWVNQWAENTTYTVTIKNDMTDVAGNKLWHDYVFMFTTIDSSRPRVIYTSPKAMEQQVIERPSIQLYFSEAMETSSVEGTFQLNAIDPDNGNLIYGVGSSGSFSWSSDRRTMTFIPNIDLKMNFSYEVSVSNMTTPVHYAAVDITGTVLDANNSIGDITRDDGKFSYRFKVTERVKPWIVAVSPHDGDASVVLEPNISITFSEPMDKGSVEGALYINNGVGRSGTFTWTDDGTTVHFVPRSLLFPKTRYRVDFNGRAKDLAGNELDLVKSIASANLHLDANDPMLLYWIFNTGSAKEASDEDGVGVDIIETTKIVNYPNPFGDVSRWGYSGTFFTYILGHDVDMIEIKIYSIRGKLLKTIKESYSDKTQEGYREIYWDGRDDTLEMLANGIYIYKFDVLYNKKRISVKEKLAVVK